MRNAVLFTVGVWVQIGIADRATNALIGDIGICVAPGNETAEIGFTLRAQSQERGLGTDAVITAIQLIFAYTDVEQIVGMADVRNHASMRLMERVGMRKVATEQ